MAGASKTTTIRPGGHRLPELDGLRAWAITGVLFGHLGLSFFVGGGLGVDLFFVLSGFLITHLLLREYDRRGSIDLLAFYRRRAWRLLPALVVMLVVVDLATWIQFSASDSLFKANFVGSVWVLGFAANWTHEWIGSYIHLWSLGIEEQYYLLWAPILILLAPRLNRAWGAAILIGLALIDLELRAVLYLNDLISSGTLNNATYSHGYGLLLGSGLGMALTREGRIWVPNWPVWLRRLSLPAMILITIRLTFSLDPTPLTMGVTSPLILLACAIVIGSVVVGGGSWMRVLALAPVVWLGRISYSLYLWHLPVYVAMDSTAWGQAHMLWAGAVKIALALSLAAASFHFVEQPLLRKYARRDSTGYKGDLAPAVAS